MTNREQLVEEYIQRVQKLFELPEWKRKEEEEALDMIEKVIFKEQE